MAKQRKGFKRVCIRIYLGRGFFNHSGAVGVYCINTRAVKLL